MARGAGASLWRVVVDLADATTAATAVEAITAECEAVSAFEVGARWRVEGLSRSRPNIALVEASLALVLGEDAPMPEIERVPPRDWLRENQESFPPIRTGRFLIHGSHFAARPVGSSIAIVIDAATAFGTGEHATTRGCLLALARVARRPKRILDMGCGTGILAIAAAKRWHRPILASDIDGEAVRVTRINARRNRVAASIRAENLSRCDHRVVMRHAPFDLVLANILARPLIDLAPGFAKVLAPGGAVILSGLLARQEAAVLGAYRIQGLYLNARIAIEGWHTLVLRKRGNK